MIILLNFLFRYTLMLDIYNFFNFKCYIGGKAIAVPGELKGYSTIYEIYGGGVSWESLFEPTIRLCEEGIEVSKRLANNIKNHEDLIKKNAYLRYAFILTTSSYVNFHNRKYLSIFL